MDERKVLVTGIGGNVGQGIIRNIRHSSGSIKIIGTNTLDMSSGNHLVDVFYEVPYSYDTNYISSIIKIIEKENIELVIPSTDYEMYYLSVNKNQISCMIAGSGPAATEIYLDKYLTYQFHKQKSIAFAEACLPSEYKGRFSNAIAKPRKGRGSRGLIKYITDTVGLDDEEYMIQQMWEGIEITTAAYVSYITGKLIGFITMERSLANGATTFCKVLKKYDKEIEKILLKMIEHSDIKGSFNVQSIVNLQDEIYPFEVNCRISGTNSIRSHFGFNDVKFTIDELLYKVKPSAVTITEGVAYRYLADVIYPEGLDHYNSSDKFILF